MIARAVAERGVCALETKDRLFLIAHGEDRSRGLRPGALTRKELIGDRPHDLPLLGIGVLRFVDQDMVQPAIEFEQDPGRHVAVRQKIAGAVYQIIVVQLHPG